MESLMKSVTEVEADEEEIMIFSGFKKFKTLKLKNNFQGYFTPKFLFKSTKNLHFLTYT